MRHCNGPKKGRPGGHPSSVLLAVYILNVRPGWNVQGWCALPKAQCQDQEITAKSIEKSMRSVFCAGAPGTPDALEAVGGGNWQLNCGGTDQSRAVIKIYGMKSQFDSGLNTMLHEGEKEK